MKMRSIKDQNLPWDIKKVEIELGEESDQWLKAEIFNDNEFNLSLLNVELKTGDDSLHLELMHIDVARRLRDFLNYAVPDDK